MNDVHFSRRAILAGLAAAAGLGAFAPEALALNPQPLPPGLRASGAVTHRRQHGLTMRTQRKGAKGRGAAH